MVRFFVPQNNNFHNFPKSLTKIKIIITFCQYCTISFRGIKNLKFLSKTQDVRLYLLHIKISAKGYSIWH